MWFFRKLKAIKIQIFLSNQKNHSSNYIVYKIILENIIFLEIIMFLEIIIFLEIVLDKVMMNIILSLSIYYL